MKNQFIIPSVIIAVAILGGFWMLKSSSEPQKVTIVPQPPDISINDAARDGNIQAVKQHLAAGTDVNTKKPGITPLWWAALFDHIEIAELLIAEVADVNAKSGLGSTPLHEATNKGHKEMAELLIANGADVNVKDWFKKTALHGAVWDKEYAELLISKGADVNAKQASGVTPLDLAVHFKRTETADLLRKHGGKAGSNSTTNAYSPAASRVPTGLKN